MTPHISNLPLKIIHNFPYPAEATLDEKKNVVTSYLLDIASRGFGGIVSNISTRNYLQNPEEHAVFAFVADECERLGLRLWIYDEDGYPSGGAGGLTLAENPDFEATAVVMVKSTLNAGETVTIDLPRGHQHFLFAAAYPCGEDGALLPDENGQYTPAFTADCRYSTEAVTLQNPTDTPALALCFVRKHLYEGTHSVHNVYQSRRYIDVTNRDAVAAFLRNTYNLYAKTVPAHMNAGAGRVTPKIGQIEAVFTDEPSLMGCYINKGLYPRTIRDEYDTEMPLYPVLTYGRDVANAYASRYGRDLMPDLVHIFLGDTDRSKSVRYDYYTLLSDLYEESFFSQISDWCARNGISFSGHLLLEDDIRYHTVFEGNFFSLLRHMHFPGIDMLQSIPSMLCHSDYAFTPKLVSSIARAYNRPHVMSEVSAHAQGGNVTHDQMYASLCAQYALGVDIFTYYYGERFMDPETYTKYNHALGRIDNLMAGRTVADALLYYPIETFRMHHRPSDAQYGTYTEAENNCKRDLMAIQNTLLDNQIDFDYADYDVLSRMTVCEDGTLLSPHGDRYAALILPPMEYTPAMANLLSDTAAWGNVIRVGEGSATVSDVTDIPDLLTRRALTAEEATHGVLRLVRDTSNGRACLLVNTNEESVTASFTIAGMTAPVLYDPFADAEVPCEFTADGDEFGFTVTLGALQSLIVKEM